MNIEKRKVGRPPVMSDEERRILILKAAEAVFMKNGYGHSRMEDVAKECGVSKKTLYRFYKNKAELLSHLVRNVSSDNFISEGLQEQERAPQKRIFKLFCDLARFAFSARQIEVTRLVISQAKSNPKAARQFYEDSMLNSQKIFADELNKLFGDLISENELDLYADILIGAVIGPIQIRSLLWEEELDSIFQEIESRLQIIVRHLSFDRNYSLS